MVSVLQHLDNQTRIWEARAIYAKKDLAFGHDSLPDSVKNALNRTYQNDVVVRQGLESYAYKQAHIRREQRRCAAALFGDVMHAADIFLETHSVEGWELSTTTPARALEDEPDWVLPEQLETGEASPKVRESAFPEPAAVLIHS